MIDNVIAIVPAAGMGRRFGDGTNKPFATLGGRPLLAWTLLSLASVPEITEIIPVLREPDMEYGVCVLEEYKIPRVRRIAPGGRERQDSVFSGLKLIRGHSGAVLIHDGVRPLIEPAVIRDALRSMVDCDGVAAGVPVKDTIKEIAGDFVERTLRREALWAVQTPQVFPFSTIFSAHERAMRESFCVTDDAALVERYGGRVRMIMGSYANIKITTLDDLKIAEALMEMRGTPA